MPRMMETEAGSTVAIVEAAMPVKTRETPEWGRRVRPRCFVIVFSFLMVAPPSEAKPIFPAARERMQTKVSAPDPAM